MSSKVSQRRKEMFPGQSQVCQITPLVLAKSLGGDRLPAPEMIVMLCNSGQHVYWSRYWPDHHFRQKTGSSQINLLPFRRFGHPSFLFPEIFVQHHGHSWHDLPSGGRTAWVSVWSSGGYWRIRLRPHEVIYLIEVAGYQALFRRTPKTFRLPSWVYSLG